MSDEKKMEEAIQELTLRLDKFLLSYIERHAKDNDGNIQVTIVINAILRFIANFGQIVAASKFPKGTHEFKEEYTNYFVYCTQLYSGDFMIMANSLGINLDPILANLLQNESETPKELH